MVGFNTQIGFKARVGFWVYVDELEGSGYKGLRVSRVINVRAQASFLSMFFQRTERGKEGNGADMW